MIAVAGEALMDVIVGEAGTLTALPGGAPFNVALNVARLGCDCIYIGRLSDDRFGGRLRAELEAAGVRLAAPEPVTAPTTLALAQLDERGSADYRFYIESTSAAALGAADLPADVLKGCRLLALGGLGIVFEPIRSTLLQVAEWAPSELLILLDPNCRPRAIADIDEYRRTISSLVSRADIVKVSVEDAEFLCPGCNAVEYAIGLVARGPNVALVTDGAHPTTLVTADGVRSVEVPPVTVVDTIGAGDAFVAGLLAWLDSHPDVDPRAGDLDALQIAVEAAIEVSSAVAGSRGAALPATFHWTRGAESPTH